jgi:hypothetical protein
MPAPLLTHRRTGCPLSPQYRKAVNSILPRSKLDRIDQPTSWVSLGTGARRAITYCAEDICMTLAGDLAVALHTGRMPRDFRSAMDDEEGIQTIGALLNLSAPALRTWVARLWVVTLEILHLPAVSAARFRPSLKNSSAIEH